MPTNKVPLKITAKMMTPVVCDEWLPLEGIIYYQVMRDRFGPLELSVPGGIATPGMLEPDGDMPFAIIGADSPNWYYACSWAQPRPWWIAEGKDHWNKRFRANLADLIDFGKRRGKVHIEQGENKAYHMPIFYFVADTVEWYCVGDKVRLEYYLSVTTHIGKKRVQGWGRVAKWIVEEWPRDWSVQRDGKLTRGVPLYDAPKISDAMHYALRSPGYLSSNQMMIARPE